MITKFYPEKHKKNIIVEVDFTLDNQKFKCVGVLLREDEEKIRVGFNAKNDEVIDFLDIKYTNLIEIKKIKNNLIKKIY